MSNLKRPEKENDKLEPENPAGSPAESLPESAEAPAAPADASSLAEQLARLQGELDQLQQTLVRRQADFENYRKRLERERHEAGQRGVARLIEEVLPMLDAFERALAAHDDPSYEDYRKGFELIYRQLGDALERHGLERIEARGKLFDPHIHQAIERVETDEHEDGSVLEELQPGYALRGRVLRPAMVRVAVHPAQKADKKSSAAPERVN